MNNLDACAKFALATKTYDEAKKIISTLTDTIKASEPHFSFEKAMESFDIILQSALLVSAVQDNEYEKEERAFIESLTEYGDLMEFLNKGTNYNFSWDCISCMSPEEGKIFALSCAKAAENSANYFIPYFAVADKLIPETNFGKALLEKMRLILAALCIVDGDDVTMAVANGEFQMGSAIIEKSVAQKWLLID